MWSSDSHPAGRHGWLSHKSALLFWGSRYRHNLHNSLPNQLCQLHRLKDVSFGAISGTSTSASGVILYLHIKKILLLYSVHSFWDHALLLYINLCTTRPFHVFIIDLLAAYLTIAITPLTTKFHTISHTFKTTIWISFYCQS